MLRQQHLRPGRTPGHSRIGENSGLCILRAAFLAASLSSEVRRKEGFLMIVFLLLLIVVAILTVAVLVALAAVVAGIQSEERRLNLPAAPRNCAERLARRVIDVHISQADALRIFAARYARIQHQHQRRVRHRRRRLRGAPKGSATAGRRKELGCHLADASRRHAASATFQIGSCRAFRAGCQRHWVYVQPWRLHALTAAHTYGARAHDCDERR